MDQGSCFYASLAHLGAFSKQDVPRLDAMRVRLDGYPSQTRGASGVMGGDPNVGLFYSRTDKIKTHGPGGRDSGDV